MTIKTINKYCGIVSILLSVLVAIPLTIKTIIEGGGPWGFEIISLAVLVPLSCYLVFGIAGVLKDDDKQRSVFIVAHVLTIITGIFGYFTFPVFPFWVALVPLTLAVAGIASHRKFQYFLLLMILLSLAANGLLLKWEIDFGRTVPLFELFQPSEIVNLMM
jgi:hypothetical protein